MRSVHIFGRADGDGSIHTIQKEFLWPDHHAKLAHGTRPQQLSLSPAPGRSRISSYLTRPGLDDRLQKRYMDALLQAAGDDQNWRCIFLDCCSNSSQNLDCKPLLSSRNPHLQVTPGQEYLLRNNVMQEAGPACGKNLHNMSLSDNADALRTQCTSFQSLLFGGLPGLMTESVDQHTASESAPSPDVMSQRRDLWHQWGSDLELASPRVSRVYELSPLKSTTSDASMVQQGVPSPASSTFSSSLPQNPYTLSDVPEEVSQNEETSCTITNFQKSMFSENSQPEHLHDHSPANCDNLVTNLLRAESNKKFPNDIRKTVNVCDKMDNSCHNRLLFDYGVTRQMGSSSYICSSSEEKSLEAVNSESPAQSSDLDCSAGNNLHGVNKVSSNLDRCAHSKASTARLTELTLSELSRYFHMPILEASKELNVGLTVLKKRCRIFGIPRWPHRKMKSLNSLINNIQVLAKEDGADDAIRVQFAVEELEKQRKEMEKAPGIQLSDRTKRLRQACFKASYRKRRQVTITDHHLTSNNRNSSNGSSSNNSSSSNSYNHYCL